MSICQFMFGACYILYLIFWNAEKLINKFVHITLLHIVSRIVSMQIYFYLVRFIPVCYTVMGCRTKELSTARVDIIRNLMLYIYKKLGTYVKWCFIVIIHEKASIIVVLNNLKSERKILKTRLGCLQFRTNLILLTQLIINNNSFYAF